MALLSGEPSIISFHRDAVVDQGFEVPDDPAPQTEGGHFQPENEKTGGSGALEGRLPEELGRAAEFRLDLQEPVG